jgi:hypothetical protein
MSVESVVPGGNGNLHRARKTRPILRWTEGSNPRPSSGESARNATATISQDLRAPPRQHDPPQQTPRIFQRSLKNYPLRPRGTRRSHVALLSQSLAEQVPVGCVGAGLDLSACTNPYDLDQRAIGGLIGAGAGAAIGAAAGDGTGAASGGIAGAATTPPPPPRY